MQLPDLEQIDGSQILAKQEIMDRFHKRGGVDAALAASELDRFFWLTTTTDEPLAMVSANVDELWHCLIEFTEQYRTFCERRYGEFIHHRPRSSATPVPAAAVRNFYVLYEAHFGPRPEGADAHTPADLLAYGQGHAEELPEEIAWSGWPGRRVA